MKYLTKISKVLPAFFWCAFALLLNPPGATAQTPVRNPANPATRQPAGAVTPASSRSSPAANVAPASSRSSAVPARAATAGSPAPGAQAAPLPPPPAGSYVLMPGDIVKLSVFQEPDLDSDGAISKSGEVSFPLIGSVRLAGKSIRAAEQLIWDLYDKDYLVTPKLSLTLSQYAQHTMTVSGAVLKPGPVSLPPGGRFDVLSAIDAAGGYSENANLHAVTLRRASGGGSITCDVAAMRANPAASPEIRPGDSINIPLKIARFVTVRGHVNRPSEVEVPESGRIDLLTAITKAGDFSRLAYKRKVLVRRVGRAKPFELHAADMAKGAIPLFDLLPGDIVTVNESPW